MGGEEKDAEPFFSDAKDLTEVWPELAAEYERVTKQKLDPNTTFESFQHTVNETLRKATSKRISHARIVLNNVGACLQQFGSILSGPAAMAFPSSGQCWNAINLVILAAQKFSDVLDGFITLMERCAAFLSRLNIFLKQKLAKSGNMLPTNLRRPAYDILGHFINILKSSYRLSTSKREKCKLFFDIILFNGDAGVQSSLDLLEQQVQSFTEIEIDQILMDVKGLAHYLKESDEVRQQHCAEIREYFESIYKVGEETLAVTQQIKTSLEGRVSQDKNREYLDKIRKTFYLKANEETWAIRHGHLCKVRIPESGGWLEREGLGFHAWADAHNRHNKVKILTIEGNSGFGKTFVANKAISYLQGKYQSNTSSDRVAVAYYYYGENIKDGQVGEDREDSLERCMRCIVYQFALADPAYARAVAEVCQHPDSIVRVSEIWDRLIVKRQHAMKGTYYICLDGLESEKAEELVATIAQNVLFDIEGISIRLFLSITDQVAARIPEEPQRVRRILLGPVKYVENRLVHLDASELGETSTIVSLINASDLEAMARVRVDEIGKKKPVLKTVMTEENIRNLVAGVYGHYDHLEAKLIRINACDSRQKIQDVIDSIGDDLKTTIRTSLKVFSESLNIEQIRQLNELLVWVAGSNGTSIELLQSALYHALRKDAPDMLPDLISTTFSTLLSFDQYGNVRLKSDQFLEILREENKSHFQLSRSGSTTVNLTEVEVDLCSHIVKNVCGEQVYRRFNFDDFFSSLVGKQRVSLRVDDEDPLNVAITRTCLRALHQESDDEHLKELRLYAAVWFYEHLRFFFDRIDYFEPHRESLTEIGSDLSHLLYEPDILVEFWDKENLLGTIKYDFVFSDDCIEPMVKLLRNPHAALGYAHDEERRKWIESSINAKASRYAILERLTSRLAKKWFSCKTMADQELFWLPYGIFSKMRWGKFEPVVPLKSLDEYLEWVLEHTGIDKTNPVWLYRVGTTFRMNEHFEAALSTLKEAEIDLGNNWTVLLQIAETYAGLKQFKLALEYLHKIKANSSQLFDTDEDFKDMYWVRVLMREGNFYRELNDNTAAIQCYQDILAQDAEQARACHTDALAALFTIWIENGDSDSIVSFLRGKRAESRLHYWLGHVIGSRDEMHKNVIQAAKQLSVVGEVSKMYDEVIEAKTETKVEPEEDEADGERRSGGWDLDLSDTLRDNLRLFRAILNFYASQLHHEHEKAISVWEQMVLKPSNTTDAYWIACKARSWLARALLDKAMAKPAVVDYTTRLETMSRSNHAHIRDFRHSQYDPSFCLLRLYLLQDRQDMVNNEARALLRGVFDNWPKDLNDPTLGSRFGVLAQVLAVLNLDDDAVAAWQALKPRQYEQKATTGTDAVETEADRPKDQPAKSPSLTVEAYICENWCDGCDEQWDDVLNDCWDCKQCLCVQFCTPCHEKLLANRFSPVICSKDHDFLYIPKLDAEKWAALPDDHIIVGGKSMPREEWLGGFRERWGVQQEKIDAYKIEMARRVRAALCIRQYVLRWKRRTRRRDNLKMGTTFPMRSH